MSSCRRCVKGGEIPGWELPKPPEMPGAAGHRGCPVPTQWEGGRAGFGGQIEGKKRDKKKKKPQFANSQIGDVNSNHLLRCSVLGHHQHLLGGPGSLQNGVLGPESDFGAVGTAQSVLHARTGSSVPQQPCELGVPCSRCSSGLPLSFPAPSYGWC